jgi:CRP-like cAMP-binding protein
MSAPVELLRAVPLFSGLGDKDLKHLASSFKELRFRAGEVVAEEGSRTGIRFLVVAEGTAAVSVQGEPRASIGPGAAFGEIALIDEGDRSATVTAETELVCFGITPWVFKPLVEENSTIAWNLLQTLARRLREAENR